MPTLKKKAETPFPRVLLSSTKQDWGTPDWLFDILDEPAEIGGKEHPERI